MKTHPVSPSRIAKKGIIDLYCGGRNANYITHISVILQVLRQLQQHTDIFANHDTHLKLQDKNTIRHIDGAQDMSDHRHKPSGH